MRITLLRKNLSKALKIAAPAISNQADLAILSNLLIKADKNNITISATDLEIGVTIKVGGKVEEPGEITVPAQIFDEYVSNSTNKTTELLTKADTLHLSDGQSKAQIKGQPAEDFPQIPEIKQEKTETINVSNKRLLQALTRVLIAPAQDDSRPVLAGVLFGIQPKGLTLAGTDSYRLAEEKILLEETASPQQLIVPIKACQEMVRILEREAASSIKILVAENQIGFQTGETILISRQIEGGYPDYRQIIPDQFQTEALIDREELLNATKTAWLFSRDQANNITLQVDPSGQMKILATSPQVGESESRVKLIKTKGPGVEASFNVKFINDVLSILKTEQVELKLNEPMQPGMIRAKGVEDYLYLIMPLKNQ